MIDWSDLLNTEPIKTCDRRETGTPVRPASLKRRLVIESLKRKKEEPRASGSCGNIRNQHGAMNLSTMENSFDDIDGHDREYSRNWRSLYYERLETHRCDWLNRPTCDKDQKDVFTPHPTTQDSDNFCVGSAIGKDIEHHRSIFSDGFDDDEGIHEHKILNSIEFKHQVNRQSSEYSPDNIFHLPIFFNREDPQFDDDSVTDDSVFVLSLPMSHTVGRVYTPRRTLRVNPLIQNVASLQMN